MRLSNKLLEHGYVKERLKSSLMKFYGRYGDLIKQYEVSFSQMLNEILWPDHIQLQPPSDQTLYRTRPFTGFWEVSIEHLRRVWLADRVRLLFRTPGPVPLGLAYVLLVETNLFSELVVIFTDYALRISLCTFSILLCTLYKFYIILSYIQRDMRVVSELFDLPTYIHFLCCCHLWRMQLPSSGCRFIHGPMSLFWFPGVHDTMKLK